MMHVRAAIVEGKILERLRGRKRKGGKENG